MGHLTKPIRYTRKGLRLYCAAWFVTLAGPACAGGLPAVDLYLSQSPPLTVLEPADQDGNNGITGIVGEVTVKAATLAGYDLRPQALPWARSQRIVQSGRNQLIIPLSRTPARENQYTWIAPVMTMDRAFFSLDKQVETFEQARQTYERVAVGMGSAQEQMLRDEGFSNAQIYSLKIGENPAQMLLLGRVDAWFNGVPETRYFWPQVSDRPLRMSPALMKSDLYLACSKICDPTMVDDLRKAIETLRSDGTIKRITDAYLAKTAAQVSKSLQSAPQQSAPKDSHHQPAPRQPADLPRTHRP
ncbi:transporter substrate-binding domain-containing protein [Pseudomonas baltica]|uniref:substrate-binding periplasmic protein n=1 Tax=Pseudomonas baltica TaxID=2762576 RepID=UPI00289E85D9|nr:transporter substrate-binding domain-containing protein [Pseudomonas baltica]